ncbi:myb-like protein D [Musca vetustissima]|uniref:myb-like protein D n=1 Tax=Musca vetustissima TaxID=27455 RepID=UPI002AB6E71E|nr:myb-like protein D [Musca vetustissima]
MATQELVNEIKQNVIEKFSELKSALMMREKLLLRQLDVINTTSKQQLQQQDDSDEKNNPGIEFLADNEKELLAAIRNFGRFQLTNINLALQNQNEDYIKPSDDHETMFKGLNQSVVEGNHEDEESIVVDFSHHKTLMERNAKMVNDSIINITLKEAKELIKQAKAKRELPVPPLNLEELDDEVESSIADVVSSLEANSEQYSGSNNNNKYSQTQQQQGTKQKRFKPKITINNCNGTINLRNIASLTINCSTEENIQAQIPVKYAQPGGEEGEDDDVEEPHSSATKAKDNHSSKTLVESSVVSSSSNTEECTSPTSTSHSTTPNSLSNYSSNNSSRSHSKKQKLKKSHKTQTNSMENKPPVASGSTDYAAADSSSPNEVTCDFYNRLLNEIKRSIHQQQKTRTKCSSTTQSHRQLNAADSTTSQTTCSDYGDTQNGNSRRFVLKNFENLKIILEANSSCDEESFHPVQIEQWLAEIISETDLEPMQNTDILEHSKIHNESQDT